MPYREKKIRLKKGTKVFLLVFALTIVSIAVLIGALKNSTNGSTIPVGTPSDTTQENSSDTSEELPTEPMKPPAVVSVLGAGDNLIHSGLYMQAKRRAVDGTYDFIPPYNEVADMIAAADIATVNQESVMASIYEPSGYPMFNTPTQAGDALTAIGFDVFNLANNHVLDKGEKGLLSTFDYFKTKPDLKVVGLYENQADYEQIRTIEKDGIVFSFVGMTSHTNGLSLPKGSDIVIPNTEVEQVKRDITAAKAVSDVVVVNVHWGEEYTHTPNEKQRELAKIMVESGADIIYGHHPHVIQPVEYITRADGTKAIVCYSLGNFISAQDRGARMLGGTLQVEITKEFENNTISITDATFTPIVTQFENGYAHIRNYSFSKYTKELAAVHGVRKFSPEFSYEYLQNIINSVIDKQFLK